MYLVEQTRYLFEEKALLEIDKVEEDDYFKRITKIIIKKCQLMRKYPLEKEFVTRALLNPPPLVTDEIAALNAKYMEKYKSKSTQENFIIKNC